MVSIVIFQKIWTKIMGIGVHEDIGELTILDKLDGLFLAPAGLPRCVAVTVDERASASTDRPRLLKHTTTQRHVEHPTAILLVPASNNDAGAQTVLVLVHDLLEEVGGDLGLGWAAALDGVHVKVVRDNIGDGLRIGGTAGATTVDAIRQMGELVRDAVGDVAAHGGSRVGAEDDALVVCDGHDRGAEVDLALFEVAGDVHAVDRHVWDKRATLCDVRMRNGDVVVELQWREARFLSTEEVE